MASPDVQPGLGFTPRPGCPGAESSPVEVLTAELVSPGTPEESLVGAEPLVPFGGTLVVPVVGAGPVGPDAPVAPVSPVAPVAPVPPVAPVEPVAPVAPGAELVGDVGTADVVLPTVVGAVDVMAGGTVASPFDSPQPEGSTDSPQTDANA